MNQLPTWQNKLCRILVLSSKLASILFLKSGLSSLLCRKGFSFENAILTQKNIHGFMENVIREIII